MTDYNDVGISRQLDWPRIRHLFRLGLFAALTTLIGDLLLGWGVENETLSGLPRMLSAYAASDGRILASALLGLFGLTLEGLCYFGIYRLFAERAPRYAHAYRAGILGYVIFGGCGFHLPVCAMAFLARHGLEESLLLKYAAYFALPGFALFWVFFLVLEITQIRVFAKGLTPYPKGCWVFSLPVGMAAAMLVNVFGNQPWVNALSCAWIGVGNVWMFAGLLAAMKKRGEDIPLQIPPYGHNDWRELFALFRKAEIL